MKLNDVKVYVSVTASFDADGRILPREIVWEDGSEYQIDRVVAITQAAAMKAGGSGDRYTIRMNGQQSYLFFQHKGKQYWKMVCGEKIGFV